MAHSWVDSNHSITIRVGMCDAASENIKKGIPLCCVDFRQSSLASMLVATYVRS